MTRSLTGFFTSFEPHRQTMHNPNAFLGKRVDTTRWIIPDGYVKCAMTGKLCTEEQASISFAHWMFEREFLIENGIYVEDADWLCEEGYDLIMAKLDELGYLDYYYGLDPNRTDLLPAQPGDALPGVPTPGDLLAPEPEAPEDYLMPDVTIVRIDGGKFAVIDERRVTDTGIVYRLHVLHVARGGVYLTNWCITRPAYLIEDWWIVPQKASAPGTDVSALSA